MADEMNRRDFIKYAGIAGIASAAMLANAKKAMADTVITDEYISLDGVKYSKSSTVVVGTGGAVDYVCDGNNDEVQIQAAIDYVSGIGGGSILIREGTYIIESQITISSDKIHIIGMGKGTVLNLAATALDAIEVGDDTGNTFHFELYDMLIEGKSTDQGDGYDTGTAIKMINCKECIMSGVEIQKGTNGVVIEASGAGNSSSLIKFDNVKISFMEGNGVDIHTLADGDSANPWNNAHFFNGCYIQHNGTGVYVERASPTLSGEVSHHSFSNCYIETSTTTDILLDARRAKYLRFSNVAFDGKSGFTQIVIDSNCDNFGFLNTSFDCDINDAGTRTFVFDFNSGMSVRNGLIITQPDASCTDKAFSIVNEGTGQGIGITQTGNGKALEIITQSTIERGINLYNNVVYTGSWGLLTVRLDDPSSTGHAAQLQNDGTGRCLYVDQNGNGIGIELQTNATTQPGLNINATGGSTPIRLVPISAAPGSPSEGDIYADTDHHLYYYNGTTWISIA